MHAVSLAVEKIYPEVYSVIELGGQDAKIIVFKDDAETGRKKKIPSMNDKCAGGTGAVIDKINAKLRIPADELSGLAYENVKLHKVAGKCGVFAETDINGLQKTGTPPDEFMASLFEAIVLQNLSVLTRGHTLRPHVLLLGGPNGFIRGMREAWQANIPRMWKERKVEIPEGMDSKDLIKVPENSQHFAALGAVEFGCDEDEEVGQYTGTEKLSYYIDFGCAAEKAGPEARAWLKNLPSSTCSSGSTPSRSSSPNPLRPARLCAALWASMEAPPRPKPCCSMSRVRSSARPTSSRTATPSRTPSKCSRSSARRLKARARRWECWGAARHHYGKPAAAPCPRLRQSRSRTFIT